MSAQKRKNSIGGRIAWALVWFIIGAAAGLLLSKVLGPPQEQEPVVASQQGGDTVAADRSRPSPPPTGVNDTGNISGDTAGYVQPSDTATGTVAGDTASADRPGIDEPVDDTGTHDADTSTPRMTRVERDRESVKRRIYDYYSALSRDDLEASINCWHEDTANTRANIKQAMKDFEQILVLRETLKITDLETKEASVTFTIRAYYENDAFNIYKKGAKLTKKEGHWKLVDTWNP